MNNIRSQEPIAILGMALRLPRGVSSPEGFWKTLADGEDLIETVPPERWRAALFQGTDLNEPGTAYDAHGGFIADADAFDANFFGMSSREAHRSDPHQRFLLELTWEALERAAINPQTLARSQTGVWIGISNNDWIRMLLDDPRKIDGFTSLAASNSVIAGRIAHFLGSYGPAEVVDAACSSALVALHNAVQSLRRGETNLAIAGAANLILAPEVHICFSRNGMLSRSGRCHAFDNAADGFVRGEACAVFVLKRLTDAQRDGDPILAIIHGSAVNQDGRSSRISVPNIRAQQKVMRAALDDAGVEASAVSYVEAHGTGTPVGDPLEFLSIGEVYGAGRSAQDPLRIGSVKTNLGHSEGAAGLAGLAKLVLMLQPGRDIVPHLHLTSPSSRIDWNRWPIEIPRSRMPWPKDTGSRFAGLSTFGFNGTNVHVIVGSADALCHAVPPANDTASESTALCISAADAQALRVLAASYSAFLRETKHPFSEICENVLRSRARLKYRLVIQSSDSISAAKALDEWLAGSEAEGVFFSEGDWAGDSPDLEFLPLAAKNYLTGAKMQPSARSSSRISLPLYPFQRQRFWLGDTRESEWRREREQIWQSALAEASRESERGPLGWNPADYPKRWDLLAKLTLAHARNVLVRTGAFPEGDPATVDDVMQNCRFQPAYSRLITRWLRNLANAGVLIQEGERFRPTPEFADLPLDVPWQSVEAALVEDRGTLAYFHRCSDLLEDVLTGRISALETLNPNGQFEFADAVQRTSAQSHYIYAIVGSAVRCLVQGWGKKRNVRILEIGAGAGGTTSAIAPLLPKDQTEYWFTDASDLALRRARQSFEQFPFMHYSTFDVEHEPENQGIPAGYFDVIVAANVLHASRNVQSSLDRVRRLLAPGGVMAMVETTTRQVCFDMSSELIECALHPHASVEAEKPLLNAQGWCDILAENGFSDVRAVPDEASPASAVGIHVVLAQREFESSQHRTREESASRMRDLRGVVANVPPQDRLGVIRDYLKAQIANVLGIRSSDEMDANTPLAELGMDSIMALELKNSFQQSSGMRLPASFMFEYPTIADAAIYLNAIIGSERNEDGAQGCATEYEDIAL